MAEQSSAREVQIITQLDGKPRKGVRVDFDPYETRHAIFPGSEQELQPRFSCKSEADGSVRISKLHPRYYYVAATTRTKNKMRATLYRRSATFASKEEHVLDAVGREVQYASSGPGAMDSRCRKVACHRTCEIVQSKDSNRTNDVGRSVSLQSKTSNRMSEAAQFADLQNKTSNQTNSVQSAPFQNNILGSGETGGAAEAMPLQNSTPAEAIGASPQNKISNGRLKLRPFSPRPKLHNA
jgi:hypothetical protein